MHIECTTLCLTPYLFPSRQLTQFISGGKGRGEEEAFALNSGCSTTCNCSTKPQMEELCYVFISRFLFNVRLLLLLQLKQTPTDSSYKPSFKKKDQPGTEKHQYKYYGYSLKFRGDRCSYDSKIFPQRYTMGFPTTLQCHIFILSIFINILILLFFVSY